MPETSFFEQFDQGTKSPAPPGRDPARAFGVVAVVGMAVLVVAGLAWFVFLRDDARSVDELLNEGLSAHVAGDFVTASQLYEEILAEEPTNKFAHYNIGLIAQTQGRAEDAERSYRLALTTDPAYTPAIFNLAVLRYEAEDHDEAIELYRLLLSIEPNNASAHLNLGYALRDSGRVAEGDREIATAVQLDPSLGPQVPPTTETTVGSDGDGQLDDGSDGQLDDAPED